MDIETLVINDNIEVILIVIYDGLNYFTFYLPDYNLDNIWLLNALITYLNLKYCQLVEGIRRMKAKVSPQTIYYLSFT